MKSKIEEFRIRSADRRTLAAFGYTHGMGDPHAANRLLLEQVVTRGPGHTAPSLREALARGQAPPELAACLSALSHSNQAPSHSNQRTRRA